MNALIAQDAEAVTLASAALQQAKDSQVRRIALRIAESHAGELQLLRTWRALWYPEEPATDFPSGSPQSQSIPECETKSFDLWFLQTMISQRQQSIAIAQAAVAQADHIDLKNFAQTSQANWTSEIASMQSIVERLLATEAS